MIKMVETTLCDVCNSPINEGENYRMEEHYMEFDICPRCVKKAVSSEYEKILFPTKESITSSSSSSNGEFLGIMKNHD